PAAEDVLDALAHEPAQLVGVEPVLAGSPGPGRDVAEQRVHELADVRLDLAVGQVRADQANAAVDVVADAAGGDHATLVRVGGGDAADAEAVPPVDVRHGQAGVLDAGQEGDVGHLVGGLVLAELFDQPLAGEDPA